MNRGAADGRRSPSQGASLEATPGRSSPARGDFRHTIAAAGDPIRGALIGVVPLSAGLLLTAGALARSTSRQRTLQRDAAQVSASFSSYFERARSLDLLLAQDPAFRPDRNGTVDRAEANRALAYLEVLYPEAIGEACLIDEQGASWPGSPKESWRRLRPVDDEAANAFFAPRSPRSGRGVPGPALRVARHRATGSSRTRRGSGCPTVAG